MQLQRTQTLVNPLNGHLSLKIDFFQNGSSFDHLQRHNYYSILWIKTGSGKLRMNFSEYAVSPASIIFSAPYQPFMIETPGTPESLSGVAIYFHPDFFCIHKHQREVSCNGVLFNNPYQSPALHVPAAEAAQFDFIIEQLSAEMQRAEVGQSELLVSHLKIFLIHATRLKTKQMPQRTPDAQAEQGDAPVLLKRLKDFIETHFRTKHAPSEYAALLHISPKALAKLTKAHFEKTLTDLIAERIIIEAKREFYLTSKSVKEVAHELGFQDEYYFSRFFKNNTDVSPSVYRETVGFAAGEIH